MSTMTAADAIHRLAPVLNSEEVEEGLAPEVLYDGQRLCIETVIGMLAPLRAAVPDLRWSLDQVVAEGAWASSLWTVTGTHEDTFRHPVLGPAPATGERIRFVYNLFSRIEGDQIVEMRDVSDWLTLFQQLRVLPVLGIGEGIHTIGARPLRRSA